MGQRNRPRKIKKVQPSSPRSKSGSFGKKVARKQMLTARKQFMKDFKSQMANFKKQVKCSQCDRQPAQDENIDDWHVNKHSENIDLVCTTCYNKEESEEANE